MFKQTCLIGTVTFLQLPFFSLHSVYYHIIPRISGKQAIIKAIDHAIHTGFKLDLFNNDQLDELMNYRLMRGFKVLFKRTPLNKAISLRPRFVHDWL